MNRTARIFGKEALVTNTQYFSDDEHAGFERDGYLCVPKLFSGRTLRQLIKWVNEVEAFAEEPGKSMFYYEDSVKDPAKRVLSRIEYFADFHSKLGDLLRGDHLRGRVAELFGAPAILFKEKINFKMPGGQGFQPHQDVQAGWEEYGRIHMTLLISIDPATEKNGCLEVAGGHHRRGLIGQMWEPLRDRELDGVDFIKTPTAPGDAVFFDSFAPHRSAPNLTRKRRRILYITYGLEADGDWREKYFTDKRTNYPPDVERDPDKVYEYKV